MTIVVEEIGVRSLTLITMEPGDMLGSMAYEYAYRFWIKVLKRGPDECWPWKQSLNRPNGYGQFDYKTPDGKRVKKNASRVAYELTYGPLPDDVLVCHTCDNNPCCNPQHLFPGTNADNSTDMVQKGRSCRGEKNNKAKLTADLVLQIRRLLENKQPGVEIAMAYGISKQAVSDIKSKRVWAHL